MRWGQGRADVSASVRLVSSYQIEEILQSEFL